MWDATQSHDLRAMQGQHQMTRPPILHQVEVHPGSDRSRLGEVDHDIGPPDQPSAYRQHETDPAAPILGSAQGQRAKREGILSRMELGWSGAQTSTARPLRAAAAATSST